MENKRSKGVTFWAWWFIINGFWKLSATLFRINESGLGLTTYVSIGSIILLILGINILRLKEWSRKWIIYFSIFAPFEALFLLPKSKFVATLRMSKPGTKVDGYIFFVIFFTTICSLIVIYFFTRPKVKEQFK